MLEISALIFHLSSLVIVCISSSFTRVLLILVISFTADFVPSRRQDVESFARCFAFWLWSVLPITTVALPLPAGNMTILSFFLSVSNAPCSTSNRLSDYRVERTPGTESVQLRSGLLSKPRRLKRIFKFGQVFPLWYINEMQALEEIAPPKFQPKHGSDMLSTPLSLSSVPITRKHKQ